MCKGQQEDMRDKEEIKSRRDQECNLIGYAKIRQVCRRDTEQKISRSILIACEQAHLACYCICASILAAEVVFFSPARLARRLPPPRCSCELSEPARRLINSSRNKLIESTHKTK